MNTITNIVANGDFSTANGQLYAFIYTFDTGNSGVAYHKTPNPPFQIGEQVSVISKGQFDNNGNAKISVKKPDSQYAQGGGQQGGYQQQSRPPAQQQARPAASPANAPNGQRTGMCINKAVDLIIAGKCPVPQGRDTISHIQNVAYDLIQVSVALEGGWKPSQPMQQQAQAPAQQAPAQQQPPANQGYQQQGGVTQTEPASIEEDVPF